MGLSLYEIDAELEALLNASVGEGGEITPEAEAAITALEIARDEKALAVAAYALGQLAEAEAVKAQARRLTERAARHERHAESLKRYLAAHLPAGTKLRDSRVEIGWRSSEAVEIENEEKLPYNFLRVTTSADKVAIKAALKEGKQIPGAALVKRQHLSIK